MQVNREKRLKKMEALLLEGPIHRVDIGKKLRMTAWSVRRDIERLLSLGSDVHYTDNKSGKHKSDGWVATNAVFSDNLML